MHIRYYIILCYIALFIWMSFGCHITHCMIPLPCSILSRFLRLVNLPAKMVLVRVAGEVLWGMLHRNVFSLYLKVLKLETRWESLWLHCTFKSHRKGRKASNDEPTCETEALRVSAQGNIHEIHIWCYFSGLFQCLYLSICSFKGKAHLKVHILSSFTHSTTFFHL